MKKKRYTQAQIAFALRQAELCTSVSEIVWKMGRYEATFYRWKQKFGGLGMAEVRRLKRLEEENPKHKQLVADLSPLRGCASRCCGTPSGERYEARYQARSGGLNDSGLEGQ